jgi:hypothetical protein
LQELRFDIAFASAASKILFYVFSVDEGRVGIYVYNNNNNKNKTTTTTTSPSTENRILIDLYESAWDFEGM